MPYKNKEDAFKNGREWRKNHPQKKRMRDYALQRFGITQEEYDELFQLQNGKCAVCGEGNFDIKGNPSNLCIDHDHETGKVRGLLCTRCNLALGLLGDKKENVLRLEHYLNALIV